MFTVRGLKLLLRFLAVGLTLACIAAIVFFFAGSPFYRIMTKKKAEALCKESYGGKLYVTGVKFYRDSGIYAALLSDGDTENHRLLYSPDDNSWSDEYRETQIAVTGYTLRGGLINAVDGDADVDINFTCGYSLIGEMPEYTIANARFSFGKLERGEFASKVLESLTATEDVMIEHYTFVCDGYELELHRGSIPKSVKGIDVKIKAKNTISSHG